MLGSVNNSQTYTSPLSPYEANTILAQSRAMLSSGSCPTPLSRAMLEGAIDYLGTLINDLQQGKAIYLARVGLEQANNQSQNTLTIGVIQKEKLKYTRTQAPKEMQKADRIPISLMDFEALKRNQPLGSIEPAMPQVFFISEELLVPKSDGLVRNLGYQEYYEASPYKDLVPSVRPGSELINIHYPLSFRQAPMPVRGEIVNAEGQALKVSGPCASDPAVWRLRSGQSNLTEIKYQIQQSPEDQLITVSPDVFQPSQDEITYWQKAMPLPKLLEDRIRESPQDLLHLLVSYMGLVNKETNLTNFRYIAHPSFSEFLESNKEYMPMIVNELKVGHCDLLSWFLAAQIRAHGKPAWIAHGRVTTDNGKAFQGAYGHSIVLTTDDKGKLIQIDPTQYVKPDKAYHPDVMSKEALIELGIEFKKATTNSGRVAVLRKFDTSLQALRTSPQAQSKDISQDYRDLAHAYFASLIDSSERSKFDNLDTQLRAQIVSWDHLPEVDQYNVDDLIGLVNKWGELRRPRALMISYDTEGIKDTVLSKAARELKYLIANLSAKYKIPVFHMYDLEEAFIEYIRCGRAVDLELQKKLIERSSGDDFLTAWQSSIEDLQLTLRAISVSMIKLHNFDIAWTSSMPMIKRSNSLDGYEYSKQFIDYVKGIDSDDRLAFPRNDINAGRTLLGDWVVFSAEFQQSCINPDYRKTFVSKWSETEGDSNFFRALVAKSLSVDYRKASPVNLSPVYSKPSADFIYPLYLPTEEQSLLRHNFLRAIRSLDSQTTKVKVREEADLREYNHGDSVRDINWKASAKGDRFYVNKQPHLIQGVNSPVYILLDNLSNLEDLYKSSDRLILTELIRAVQQEMKYSHRETYITTGKMYIKVRADIPAEVIAETLSQYSNIAIAPSINLNGKPQLAPNLLYLSANYNHITAMQYIYSGAPRCNLRTIYLRDPQFIVCPRISEEWVREGFKKQS